MTVIKDKCLGNFCYQGKVSAKVIDKRNRVLSSRCSHNGGTDKFFTELAKILSNYPGANIRHIRPAFIALYKLTNENLNAATAWKDLYGETEDNNGNKKKNMQNATQLIPLDTSIFNSNISVPSADLQLKIPFSYISDSTVHMFALFPESITDDNSNNRNPAADSLEEAIAYFKLVENGSWSPITIDKTAVTNSLVINWSLAFSDMEG